MRSGDAKPQPIPAAGSRGRDLLVQIGWYAPASVLPALLGLAFTAVFTRAFSAVEFGVYSLAMTAAGFLAAAATQWLQQGITRFLSSQTGSGGGDRLRGAVALGLVIVSVGIMGASGATLLLAWATGRSPMWVWIVAAGASALATAHFSALMSVLQAGMRAGRYAAYKVLEAATRFTLTVVVGLGLHQGAVSLVWAAAASAGILIPFLWLDAGVPHPRDVLAQARRHVPALRTLASYGLPMVGWYLAAVFLDVGDRYLIQLLRGSAEVGLYAANYSLVYGAVGLLSAPMLLAAHPFLMRAWGEGRSVEAAAWLGRIARWYLVLGAVLTGSVWLVARDVAGLLLGPQFRDGWVILAPLLAGFVLWQLGMYTHKPLEFAGRTRTMFVAALVVAALKVALNLALLPTFGYEAAAWTTMGCFATYAVATYALGRRTLHWRIDVEGAGILTFGVAAAVAAGLGVSVIVHRTWGGPAASAARFIWAAALAGVVVRHEWRAARVPAAGVV